MKPKLIALACCGLLGGVVAAQDGKIETRIGELELEQGLPTKKSVGLLFDEMDF